MKQFRRTMIIAAVVATLVLVTSAVAYAQASISSGGDAVITSGKVLSVPITATCDPVGQETTFIDVTVTQPRGKGAFVEGQGSVEPVICDSTPHTYKVTVPRT